MGSDYPLITLCRVGEAALAMAQDSCEVCVAYVQRQYFGFKIYFIKVVIFGLSPQWKYDQ